jgi:hypothetical protein
VRSLALLGVGCLAACATRVDDLGTLLDATLDAGLADAASLGDAALDAGGSAGWPCGWAPHDGGYGLDAGPVLCGDFTECECLFFGWQPLCRPDYCPDCAGGRTFAACAAFDDPLAACPACPERDAGAELDAGSTCHGFGAGNCPLDGGCVAQYCPAEPRTGQPPFVECASPGDPPYPCDIAGPVQKPSAPALCPRATHAVFTATAAFVGCEAGPPVCHVDDPFVMAGPGQLGSVLGGQTPPDCRWPAVPAWDEVGLFYYGCVEASECPAAVLCASPPATLLELSHPDFPVFDKSCNDVSDCVVRLHAGASSDAICRLSAIGVNTNAATGFDAAETECRRQASFHFACTSTTWLAADDLTVAALRSTVPITDTSTVISLACVEHSCQTTIP